MKRALRWIILIAVFTMLTGCAAYSEYLGSIAENVSKGVKQGQYPETQVLVLTQAKAPETIHLRGNGWNYVVTLPKGILNFKAVGENTHHRCEYNPDLMVLQSYISGKGVFQLLCTRRGHCVKSLVIHTINGTHKFWIYPNAVHGHSGEPEEVAMDQWATFLELDLATPKKELSV